MHSGGDANDNRPCSASDFNECPWCRIDRFQSLAFPRPLISWNSFGVSHDPSSRRTHAPRLPLSRRLSTSSASLEPHVTGKVIASSTDRGRLVRRSACHFVSTSSSASFARVSPPKFSLTPESMGFERCADDTGSDSGVSDDVDLSERRIRLVTLRGDAVSFSDAFWRTKSTLWRFPELTSAAASLASACRPVPPATVSFEQRSSFVELSLGKPVCVRSFSRVPDFTCSSSGSVDSNSTSSFVLLFLWYSVCFRTFNFRVDDFTSNGWSVCDSDLVRMWISIIFSFKRRISFGSLMVFFRRFPLASLNRSVSALLHSASASVVRSPLCFRSFVFVCVSTIRSVASSFPDISCSRLSCVTSFVLRVRLLTEFDISTESGTSETVSVCFASFFFRLRALNSIRGSSSIASPCRLFLRLVSTHADASITTSWLKRRPCCCCVPVSWMFVAWRWLFLRVAMSSCFILEKVGKLCPKHPTSLVCFNSVIYNH